MHTDAVRGITLGLAVLVCGTAARGRAQDAVPPIPAATHAEKATPAAVEPALAGPTAAEPAPAEPAPALAEPATVEPVVPEAAPVLALSQAHAEQQQLSALRVRLRDLELEQEDTSTVLPWTVIIVGVAAAVVGASIGIERVASCESSCSGPFWPGWVVVGGAALGSVGLLWLKLTEEDLSELRSRHYQLQNQIDALELSRTRGGTTSAALRGPMLQWHVRF